MINKIYCGNCVDVMKVKIPDESVDLVVTSPPYDDIRDYKGYEFNYKKIADQLLRLVKQGGVVVWIVGDQVVNGSETLTSFKHALYFKYIGFNVHDTMIYQKNGVRFPYINRYHNCFEYMFIFSKGKPKTYNLIHDVKNLNPYIEKGNAGERQKDGSLKPKKMLPIKIYGKRYNVWKVDCGYMKSSTYKDAFNHPAIFPEKLARDHIISWSNEDDIVLDPMCGSGTTLVEAYKANRNYIGIDISKEYCDLSEKRLKDIKSQMRLF